MRDRYWLDLHVTNIKFFTMQLNSVTLSKLATFSGTQGAMSRRQAGCNDANGPTPLMWSPCS